MKTFAKCCEEFSLPCSLNGGKMNFIQSLTSSSIAVQSIDKKHLFVRLILWENEASRRRTCNRLNSFHQYTVIFILNHPPLQSSLTPV